MCVCARMHACACACVRACVYRSGPVYMYIIICTKPKSVAVGIIYRYNIWDIYVLKTIGRSIVATNITHTLYTYKYIHANVRLHSTYVTEGHPSETVAHTLGRPRKFFFFFFGDIDLYLYAFSPHYTSCLRTVSTIADHACYTYTRNNTILYILCISARAAHVYLLLLLLLLYIRF